jgi:lipopolysaccharide/colanic/teichoic acid biosynthesis glycosyltransferase
MYPWKQGPSTRITYARSCFHKSSRVPVRPDGCPRTEPQDRQPVLRLRSFIRRGDAKLLAEPGVALLRTSQKIVHGITYAVTDISNALSLNASNSDAKPTSTPLAPDITRVPAWKRVLDVSGVLIGFPVLLPIMLLTAIFVKLQSKGPVLFKQERVGFLGKKFIVFKFRTMLVDTDTAIHETHVASLIETNEPMIKLDARGDPRLIPFGRILRAAGLDELPQLINVLRGEMSIVGPRPCLPSEYSKHLTWQRERFRTPPGLTGLWQVSGKNRTTFNDMIDLDIKYLQTQSLWLDLKIIFGTVPVLINQIKDMWKSRRLPSCGCIKN